MILHPNINPPGSPERGIIIHIQKPTKPGPQITAKLQERIAVVKNARISVRTLLLWK